MAEQREWPSVALGVALAIGVDIVGLMVGMGFGLYLGEQVASQLLPVMVVLGQVAAVAVLALMVRRRRALLKGVYIGGALMILLAAVCTGFIFSTS
jgi:hypothetical protein